PRRDRRAARPPVVRRVPVPPGVQVAADAASAALPRVRRRGARALAQSRRRAGARRLAPRSDRQYDRGVGAPAVSGRDGRILVQIISTVASSLDVRQVLHAIVRLLTDAADVHACFVYLPEDDGVRLVLRAASDPYSHLADKVALERGEGLAWWVTERREPAFIREAALD